MFLSDNSRERESCFGEIALPCYSLFMKNTNEFGKQGKGSRFMTTRWTMVNRAGDPNALGYREAIAALCELYWYPLYAYLRRYGRNAHDAEDLIQGFFARMLDKEDFRLADGSRGKFRSFLLSALKNYVANEHKYANRLKRGGGAVSVQLDLQDAEHHYAKELADTLTPEKLFARSWAVSVLERAVGGVCNEWEALGKGDQFEALKVFLTPGKGSKSYREVAEELNMTEGAVKTAVHRLRRAYRTHLRKVIAETVSSEEEVEEEIRELFNAFGA
jgi:RNA polymerase sigma factor (sigma-70 family)